MKKKVLILFTDQHLAYSPTTLNLMAELKRNFEVKIVTFTSSSFFHKLNDSSIIYLNGSFGGGLISKLFLKLFVLLFYRDISQNEVQRKIALAKYIYKNNFDRFIAVDTRALWFLKGIVKKNIDNLSLELNSHSRQLLESVKEVKVENLIIQDKRREELHRLKNYRNVFFIQNAPPFYEDIEKASLTKRFNKSLVYAGTAVSRFGIFSCINFLEMYEKEYSLTIMGAVPPITFESILAQSSNLLHQKKIIIRNDYLSEYEYCLELSKYGIGFCFYDFLHPEIQSNYDNYYLAPSGKMFKYFSAGVPVIGVDIPGLNPVKEFNAGILLKDLTNEAIEAAIKEIAKNYPYFVKNCFLAAREYDFSKNVQKYINSILPV